MKLFSLVCLSLLAACGGKQATSSGAPSAVTVTFTAPCVDPAADAQARIADGRAEGDPLIEDGASAGTGVDVDADGVVDAVYIAGMSMLEYGLVYAMRGTCGHFVGDVGGQAELHPEGTSQHGLRDLIVVESAACEGAPCGCINGTNVFRFDGTAYVKDASVSTESTETACPAE